MDSPGPPRGELYYIIPNADGVYGVYDFRLVEIDLNTLQATLKARPPLLSTDYCLNVNRCTDFTQPWFDTSNNKSVPSDSEFQHLAAETSHLGPGNKRLEPRPNVSAAGACCSWKRIGLRSESERLYNDQRDLLRMVFYAVQRRLFAPC